MEALFAGVASAALTEGVKFLYKQAGEILTSWRERRHDEAAAAPRALPPPSSVTVGEAKPLASAPDDRALEALQTVKDRAESVKDGDVDISDPAARQVISDLRLMVEVALQASIRFAGEPPRPSSVSNIAVLTGEVEGRVTGVRAKLANVIGVKVQTGIVKPGGEVTGVDLS